MGSVKKIVNSFFVQVGKADYFINKSKPKPVIMFYHGVSKNHTGPDDKHINYKIFRNQLVSLKKYFKFIKVDNLPEIIAGVNSEEPYLSVTFDDGYKNNIDVAAEILNDLNIPATFFISTGYIGKKRWMWTDLLEYSINNTKQDIFVQDDLGLKVSLGSDEKKYEAIKSIKRVMKKNDFNKIDSLIKNISLEILDGDIPDPFGDYEFMSWEDVKSLNNSGFDIGAHTVNHPILSNIDISQAENEINDSRKTIIDRLGECSNIFCYPNGKKYDYNPDVIKVCEKMFSAALTTNYGSVSGENLYELNRVGISNLLQGKTLIRRIVNQAIGT